MSLTKEKIVENTTKYIDTAKKNGFLTPELEELLGVDFISAPATTKLDSYNAFEGGLVDHILRVMKKAYNTNKYCVREEDKISLPSLIKVVYLHQIGKCKLFTPNKSKWHRDNQGKMYEFNNDLPSMKVGERSAYYALSCGIEFTEEEFAAIVNYDKVDDKQSEYYNSTLGDVLKIAGKLAVMEAKSLAK
jgi:hypothetical protein